MRRLLLAFSVLLIGLMFSQPVFAQKKLSGVVQDEKDKLKLENATVMLLTAQDSILVDFTRSDKDGKFTLNLPDTGSYLVISSYPKYGDFYSPIDAKNNYANFSIALSTKAQLLEEAIVIGRIPIVVKGDTTEYDAGSFKVEKNAKVEDLLKVLPGISVDASGKITAQGKTVEKVLVDGEEFFGNDPKLVTRNIRSDMVDKVQVYDKKSEEAERTGVDDGQKVKTINVKLKEDKKNGLFGKALAGAGTDDYYMGQLMLNKFKGSQKIAAYGLVGNNATTSLSWQDTEKYGENDNVSYSDDGSTFYSTNGGDDFSGEGVIGIPKAINSGIMFSDKTKNGKHKLNLSYKYGKIENEGNEETISQNNLPDQIQNTNALRQIAADKDRQKLNLKYDLQFDSLTLLTITGNASRDNIWGETRNNSQTFDGNMDTLNTSESLDINDRKVEAINARALFTRKFMKKGRSLSMALSINNNESNGDGYLFSDTKIYKDNVLANSIIFDQRKDNRQKSTTKGGNISYTEPLTKELNLTLNYGLQRNDNKSLLNSFNRSSADDPYNILDSMYSNDYAFDRLSNSYRVSLNLNNEKIWANLTNNLNNDRLHQQNNYTNSELTRSFLTYNPSLSMSYRFTKSSNLYFNYSGRNQLPSLNQIQPLRSNQDALNQYIGNENLKPAFSNSFNLNYNSSKMLAGSYMYIGTYINFTNNALIQNVETLDGGRNNFKWANLDDHTNQSISAWGGYSFKLSKKLNIDNGPRLYINGSKTFNSVNSKLNKIDNMSYSIGYNISKNTTKGFDFDINLSPSYQKMSSSLQPDQNNDGFIFNSNGGMSYYFPAKVKLYVNYTYTYQAPTEALKEKFDQFLVHPGVSKKFLKNESLMLDFTVNDLLNQNTGFSRSNSNTFFIQRRSDTIRRYYMLKVSWDFTKMFVN
ncbi:outer membrane beta-barrel protein [Sphingobacterium spiritivorum]|uniref:outer membrane beta-barrel protein n=1 Tax=Sphingobacterium spiritivorum TaxID=258 RepID=UPI003DA37F30